MAISQTERQQILLQQAIKHYEVHYNHRFPLNLPITRHWPLRTSLRFFTTRLPASFRLFFFYDPSIPFVLYFFDWQKMMIDEAIAEVIAHLPEKQEPLLSGQFQLHIDGEKYEDVRAELHNDCIILKIKKFTSVSYLRIQFNFELIFELLRGSEDSQDIVKANGEPYGLKFQRFEKLLVLKSGKPNKELLQWRNHLETRLNQRGFHELFKPIKKIGKGNFATVYLVIKHEDGKKYAVKAFSKQGTYSEDKGKESLINEIEVMRKFHHKNLMKLYGVYESQNSIYISVELLEGGQLYDKIKNRHKFTSMEIKMIMKGILEGLEVMHNNKIMHRDLKPQNILLRKDNDYDCVIADFGLAEHCANDPYLFVRCGTPGYVAPEVVNLKDLKAKYDPICDLFSVGVIFHLLAIRKSPFPGKQYDQVLSQNRACKINFSGPDYLQLPQTWLDLMKRLLEKDPTKRITATEALNHDFFSKDNMFAEFNKERNTIHRESALFKEEIVNECQSPLMMTKNNARKNPGLLRDDSCLKFKMKENLLTGRTDESGETVQEIDSPGIKKRNLPRNGVESRFKKLAKE